jgi:hypothetical protein
MDLVDMGSQPKGKEGGVEAMPTASFMAANLFQSAGLTEPFNNL